MRRLALVGISALSFGCGSSVGEVQPADLVCEGCTSPFGVDFGEAAVGGAAEKEIALVNKGDQPVTVRAMTAKESLAPFESSFSCGASCPSHTIQPGGKLEVTLGYEPKGEARSSGIVALEWNLGSIAIGLAGEGVAAKIECGTERIDFGKTAAGVKAEREVTCKNKSPSPVTVSVATTGDAAFTIDDESVEVAAGASFGVPVTFEPTVEGMYSGRVAVSVAGSTLDTVALVGTTPAPALVLAHPPSEECLQFERLEVGKAGEVRIGLRNQSTTLPVGVTELRLESEGGLSLLTTDAFELPAGASSEVAIAVETDVPARFEGTLTIVSSDPGRPEFDTCFDVVVGGPILSCTATALTFEPTPVGETRTQTVTCINDGSDGPDGAEPLVVTSVSADGQFAATAELDPEGYAPHQEFTIEVAYTPVSPETDESVVVIESNGGTFEIELVGNGI